MAYIDLQIYLLKIRCVSYALFPKFSLKTCLSVPLFWHADNSAMSAFASIESGLARNESCIFGEDRVYFLKINRNNGSLNRV